MTLLDAPPQKTVAAEGPPSAPRAWRTVGLAALCPLVAGYAVIAALFALLSALASNAPFATADVLLAAGPGWLAAAGVPLWIAGAPLGVPPLLLTAFLLLLAERASAAAADRLRPARPADVLPILAAVSGSHAVFALTIALLCGAGTVGAHPAAAFFGAAALAAIGAVLGLRDLHVLRDALRSKMDAAAVLGVRIGLRVLAALFAAGAALYLVGLLGSLSTAGDLLAAHAAGAGDRLGVLLLSLAYLPNAVIGASAFLLGPGFAIGSLQADPFTVTAAPVPGLPLLSPLPEQAAHWWLALFLVPFAVGAAAGWWARHTPRAGERIRALGVAALVVGSGCLVLAALTGGQLGSGAFTPVGIPAGLFAAAGFGWLVLPGALVALPGATFRTRRPPEPDPAEPGPPDTEAPEPESQEPEAADSEASDSEAADSEAADSEAADSEAADSEAADSEAADSEAADSEAAEPEPDQHRRDAPSHEQAEPDANPVAADPPFPPDEDGPPKGRTAADRR